MFWNAKNGSVDIGGARMSFVSFGKGSRALIILPGLSDGLATVKGKALMLAPPYRLFFDKYTVYMFSRRDGLEDGFSVRDMARDQAAACRALGLERVSVLGVSQGGMIAQYLAADFPELVEKLVLAVTAPRANDTVRERVGTWIETALRGDHKRLMIDTAENSYSQSYLMKYREMYPFIGFIGKPSDYGRFLANARAILDFDASDALGSISCPTLIIGGALDRIVGPEASHELHGLIRGSELYMYPQYGHAAYEEARDFNRRVFEFLERPAVSAF